jgi:hypothetical protein
MVRDPFYCILLEKPQPNVVSIKNEMTAVYMAQRRATPKVEHYTATVSKLAKRFCIDGNLPQAGMCKVYAGAPSYIRQLVIHDTRQAARGSTAGHWSNLM